MCYKKFLKFRMPLSLFLYSLGVNRYLGKKNKKKTEKWKQQTTRQ